MEKTSGKIREENLGKSKDKRKALKNKYKENRNKFIKKRVCKRISENFN